MKAHKLSILAGCVALVVSSASWAAQSETHSHFDKKVNNTSSEHINVAKQQGKALLPQLNDNTGLGALFDDSHANIKLRTVYFNQHLPKGKRAGTAEKPDKGEFANENQSWRGSAFGAQFNFHSGYAFNHVGFDWSVFNTLSLSQGGNNDNAAGQFMTQKANGHLRSDEFVPDALADIKFKAGDKDLNINGKAGYIQFASDFLAGSSSRAVPASYRGIHLDSNIYGVNVYANVANALRQRASRGMQNFTNEAGHKISYVGELGAGYTFNNGLGLKAAYGEGHDYIKQYEGEATYSFSMPVQAKLNLKGQYFHAVKGGNLWNGVDTGFKDSGSAGTLSANYVLGGLKVGGAYTKTRAKGGMGFYQYELSHNEYGAYNTPTSVDSDFNFDGESAYQASADYKFDEVGVPGLEAAIIYTLGTGIDTNNTSIAVKGEHEIDYSVSYQFQQPALKNLKLSAIDYDLYQHGANGYKDGHTNDLRVYADYTVAVF